MNYLNNKCQWRKCGKKAEVDTPLDYPHIFLCWKHYLEYKKKTNNAHRSFGKIQRKRYLKFEHN